MNEAELTCRDVLRGAGVLAGTTVLGGAAATATAEPSGNVRLAEGTNISAHVSADGTHVAFDLVTAIWTVPIAGRETLAFRAHRDGNCHLWTVRPDG